MLRSEEMTLVSIYFSKDTAKQAVTELGKNELLHFKDLNVDMKAEKLLYIREINHMEKLVSRLRYLTADIPDIEENIKHSDVDQVEQQINKFFSRLIQLKTMKRETITNNAKLREDLYMLEETESFVGTVTEETHLIQFDFITGIVERSKKFLIRKVLHQALRRNLVIRTKDVDGECKSVFIVFAHGTEALDKVKDIFSSLGGRILDHKKFRECKKGLLELSAVISQMQQIESHNEEAIMNEQEKIKQLANTWRYYMNKEMKIYQTLNKLNFDFDRDCLIGEAWIPSDAIGRLKKIGEFKGEGTNLFAFEVNESVEMPPTYFKTNEFTDSFQALTNTYAVPSYGEVNPAVFTLFTFPMLFGCMFGDVFHGLILLLLSTFMIRNAKKFKNVSETMKMIMDGKYVIFLFSLGAMFFGFLYSDFASLAIPLFLSSKDTGRTYPFGVDHMWHHSKNEMVFLNSMKMKMSIIIGFFHMSLGVVISFMNAVYLKEPVEIYGVLVPQTIVFFSFAGYMVFLIIYKWLVTSNYPSIIGVLVNMFTNPFVVAEEMYPYQQQVQLILLILMLVSVPWMLVGKPIYMIAKKMVKKDEISGLWINQFIHVVEFGLGLISNTSSYLRLWAVSLAHAQLTRVLHEFTIGRGGFIIPVMLSGVYALGTIILLIGMEGLGSCLHAMRLNWIEFHSKFFRGKGYLFEPLGFNMVPDED
ncbi:subunit I of vacuolar-type H+-ATPase [Ordospora colligata]|uniref:V-type proton ATPase subunit a n=1 Tax=Ordospora colligata OC4 TaxID=1354746 RepID=A0A0B2UIC7_9MICR|nr:subunit I of vacuolar-type H+-ATPase [Ordospora colligata OC4]KHN68994.1 subunit I of vacuolar-type H+-ATPase [Ordospora colligata OC4]TBU14222.1 subunit I of vacuolar-type H+-ATPase [Ordospora colligata]TBU14269.1 subunit I of vacuolar-type H+-ATPase [Ordospora colligata]TBU17899.1 subunit I of vacuolar-type H+-ATPase [Ordospora colligata]